MDLNEKKNILDNVSRGDETRGMYDKLPDSIVVLSNTIDTALIELSKRNPGLFFTKEGFKSRSGAEISLLSQSNETHQWDVVTHLDVSALVALNMEETVFKVLPTELVSKTRENFEKIGEFEFALAAYLHDIEKVFRPRKSVNFNSPYIHTASSEGEFVSMVTVADLEIVNDISPQDSKRFREEFVRLLFRKDRDENESLESVFSNFYGLLVGEGNPDTVIKLLEHYDSVDQIVIKGIKGNLADSSELSEEIDGYIENAEDKNAAVCGTLLVMVDNFAQGIPGAADEKFEGRQRISMDVCTSILNQLLK